MSNETVRSFDQATILDRFFTIIFGELEGWIYTATKENIQEEKPKFRRHFFEYPAKKEEMIAFLITESAEKEVYYSPALFKQPKSNDPNNYEHITKDDFKGTQYLWADFDGKLPTEEEMKGVPEPTMKVRTSGSKHQHWYWKLSFFETDPDALEKLTRALTYHLGADLSGWDYGQVLRPAGTLHHKGKTEPSSVSILEVDSDRHIGVEEFLNIPEVPNHVWDIDINDDELTTIDSTLTLLRYKIPDEDAKLILKKKQEEGKRSSALTRVGYVCAEAGMNNLEIYSILKRCDDKWKKFAPRGEESQKKNLIGIIRYVRKKFPLHIQGEMEDDELPYFRWGEFASMKIKVDWIVDGFIQKNGTPLLTGAPGTGKTHMTFLLAIHMVLGKKFLIWNFNRPMTLCICSMEMSPPETKQELDKIMATLTEEERQIVAKNLHVIPIGSRVDLTKVTNQDKLLRRFEQYKPEGIFLDSLGQSIKGGLNDDETINDLYNFFKLRVNQGYDAFTWLIHHMRKGQLGNKSPREQDDVYGSQYIGANSSTIINLWKKNSSDPLIEVSPIKVRFAEPFEKFKIKRRDPCGFDLVSGNFIDSGYNTEEIDTGNSYDDIDLV